MADDVYAQRFQQEDILSPAQSAVSGRGERMH